MKTGTDVNGGDWLVTISRGTTAAVEPSLPLANATDVDVDVGLTSGLNVNGGGLLRRSDNDEVEAVDDAIDDAIDDAAVGSPMAVPWCCRSGLRARRSNGEPGSALFGRPKVDCLRAELGVKLAPGLQKLQLKTLQ